MANTFGIQESAKFARSLANAEGIRVVEDRDVSIPYSREDGSIVVGSPSIYSPEDYIGSLHREISKHVPKMSKLFFSQKEAEGSLRELAKAIIQEQRCEYENHGKYSGRDAALADSYQRSITNAGGLQKVMSQVPPEIAALLYHGNELRNQWQGYVPSGEPPEELKDLIEKTSGIKDKWLSLETPEDLDQLLQYITEEAQSEQQQADGDGSEESGAGGGEGEGSGGEAGEAGETPSDGEGQGEGTGGDSGGRPEGSGEGEAEGDPGESGGNTGGNQFSEAYSFLKNSGLLKPPITYKDEPPPPRKKPYECTKVRTIDLTLKLRSQTHESKEIEKVLGSFNLSKRIRKYLLATNQTGYEYGLKRGKLVNKRISSLYTQSESQEPRIFKQKRATKIQVDSAVYVLGDCSGSMDGVKYAMSSACQIAISELLQGLRIPHKMLQFTTSGYDRLHYVMKSFDEATVSRDKLLSRYGYGNLTFGSNADGEAVMESAQELMQRPEKNKILLVLSDGQPAFSGDDKRYLRDVVKVIEESKDIHLYGIGIMDKSVEKYYKENRVVKELPELEHVLMDLLSKNILK